MLRALGCCVCIAFVGMQLVLFVAKQSLDPVANGTCMGRAITAGEDPAKGFMCGECEDYFAAVAIEGGADEGYAACMCLLEWDKWSEVKSSDGARDCALDSFAAGMGR